MKNILLTIFLGLTSLIFAQQNVDLFIWAGQSNAQGFKGDAQFYPADTDNLDSSIRFNWTVANGGNSAGWTTMGAQDLGHYFTAGHFGAEVTFSRKLKQAGYNPAIFKYTQGATSIFEHWLAPGSNGLYDNMVTALNAAITALENQGHNVTVRGFIWIQGESDANSQAAASAYFNNLTTLLNDLRNNVVANASLPTILGVDEQYFKTTGHEQSEILNAHEKIALADDTIKFTSMYGYPKADATHLTPAGLITQGVDLFDSFQLLVANSKPTADTTLISNGTITSSVANPILWGQSFATNDSGILNTISFNAATAVTGTFTFTLHNGLDCNADVLATQTITNIVDGYNVVTFPGNLYLDKEHTYYFNIVSDNATVWQIRYNNASNVNGYLKTFLAADGATSCSRNFYNFDMDFSVNLVASSSSSTCIINAPGTVISNYTRASWGQSFSTSCTGNVESITFSAASSPNEAATFTLYSGDDCSGTPLFSKTLTDIVVGDNTVYIDNGLILDENNTYYFQIVSATDVVWKINYSNTSTVDGMLYTYQGGNYCGQSFPSFDMNFGVTIGANCANTANVYAFEYDNKTYEIIKEAKTWVDAAACAVARGGILAEINDVAEQNAIYAELANNANITLANTIASNGGGASYVWLGANDLAAEGTWIWDGNNDATGTQFWNGNTAANGGVSVGGLYSNWGNEPDNAQNQDCLGIALTQWPINSGSLGSAGQWNDLKASNLLYYVVEYDHVLNVANTTVGELLLYPNPVKDVLYIKNNNNVRNVIIVNSLSQIIKNVKMNNQNVAVQINFSDIGPGVYIVNIILVNGKTIIKKVLK